MEKIDHIGPLLRIIHTSIDQQLSLRAQEMDLTSSQLFVLHYINRNHDKDVFQRDIEERFELSHATVSGLISRLESKGFLVCEQGISDKRYKRLCVTEKARCCDERMHSSIQQTERLLLRGFSEEEKKQLHQYLDRILLNLGVNDAQENQKGVKEC